MTRLLNIIECSLRIAFAKSPSKRTRAIGPARFGGPLGSGAEHGLLHLPFPNLSLRESAPQPAFCISKEAEDGSAFFVGCAVQLTSGRYLGTE